MLILIHIPVPPENWHIQEQNKFGLEMANRSLVAGYIDAAELCGRLFKYLPLSHGSCHDIQLYLFQVDSVQSDSPFQGPKSDRIFVLII